MEALTQSLRLETVGSGVKVTSIQPGTSTLLPLYNDDGHLGNREQWPFQKGDRYGEVQFVGCNIASLFGVQHLYAYCCLIICNTIKCINKTKTETNHARYPSIFVTFNYKNGFFCTPFVTC